MSQDSLLEELYEERINNALEISLTVNAEYKEIVNISNKRQDKLAKYKLNRKQLLAVDKAISAANACGAEYGKSAYKQGFQDAIKLMIELKGLVLPIT